MGGGNGRGEGMTNRHGSSSRGTHLSGGFRRVQIKSRNDWLTLVATGRLTTDPITRRNLSDDVLVRMLSFLFRANHVVLLSWGTKRMFYGGEYHRFPAVIRRTSAEALWRRFNDEMGGGNKARRVGRTVFRQIVAYLTKGQLEARSCIDYYQDALVNENISLLKETEPNDDNSILERRVDAIAGFLKYSYRNHLQYDGDDGFHDITHALLKGTVRGEATVVNKLSK